MSLLVQQDLMEFQNDLEAFLANVSVAGRDRDGRDDHLRYIILMLTGNIYEMR